MSKGKPHPMTGVNDIRRTFLDFFANQGHEVVPSAPLVPRNDPTLMFTNAGMVPFKNVFTGQETRPYSQAASSQKCVRAGGKHNDLDNVGYTARHHTFFEMLGNFSFGDYFKDRAIELAWTLITKDFDLDPNRLVITVYHEDDEAHALWKKISGLSDDRIIRIATADNFWSMGETGPCGPCSEIFYDHGDHIAGGPPGSKDEDGDRFVEIWNVVFMQFDQAAGGDRKPLPKPSIDTGMGLERIAAVLQGTHDNYEIDLFKALIGASVEATGVAAKGKAAASHRVIADHLRASCFLIADGVLPSNEGRGYVLRRIMRRAMRHAQLLGAKDPLMHRLVPELVHQMGDTYTELRRGETMLAETLKLEETRFRKTLAKGLSLLSDASKDLKKGSELPGDVAFKLYDTYGFPLDLTEDALRARGITVDHPGFDAAMQKQKEAARAAWKGSGDAATEEVWFDLKEKLGATEFLGYETTEARGTIVALVQDGKSVKQVKADRDCSVIVNQTPFYGESGGQVGDTGVMSAKGTTFNVTDTIKKAGGLFVHQGRLSKGALNVGDELSLHVDADRRNQIRANHSATHLIHEALRQVLGTHVAQKGSLVAPDRLRFDFSHAKAMSGDELSAVEDLANRIVRQNSAVETHLMSHDEALETGAMALFGEKYGDEVRVVAMGAPETASGSNRKAWSIELCGGTHVKRTGDIGLVRIVGESATASGVRRIEALTGQEALRYLNQQDARVKDAAALLKVPPDAVVNRLQALMDERKSLERELATARKQAALGGSAGRDNVDAKEINGVPLRVLELTDVAVKELKGMADEALAALGSGVVAVTNTSSEDNKLSFVVAVSKDLIPKFSAGNIVRAASEAVGGKGGGRPDMAQGGGPDSARQAEAVAAITQALQKPSSK
jgi:alanyl-tRNA synthetase